VIDLRLPAAVVLEHRRQGDGGRIRTAAAERRDV
jgi:hypothetical protein